MTMVGPSQPGGPKGKEGEATTVSGGGDGSAKPKHGKHQNKHHKRDKVAQQNASTEHKSTPAAPEDGELVHVDHPPEVMEENHHDIGNGEPEVSTTATSTPSAAVEETSTAEPTPVIVKKEKEETSVPSAGGVSYAAVVKGETPAANGPSPAVVKKEEEEETSVPVEEEASAAPATSYAAAAKGETTAANTPTPVVVKKEEEETSVPAAEEVSYAAVAKGEVPAANGPSPAVVKKEEGGTSVPAVEETEPTDAGNEVVPEEMEEAPSAIAPSPSPPTEEKPSYAAVAALPTPSVSVEEGGEEMSAPAPAPAAEESEPVMMDAMNEVAPEEMDEAPSSAAVAFPPLPSEEPPSSAAAAVPVPSPPSEEKPSYAAVAALPVPEGGSKEEVEADLSSTLQTAVDEEEAEEKLEEEAEAAPSRALAIEGEVQHEAKPTYAAVVATGGDHPEVERAERGGKMSAPEEETTPPPATDAVNPEAEATITTAAAATSSEPQPPVDPVIVGEEVETNWGIGIVREIRDDGVYVVESTIWRMANDQPPMLYLQRKDVIKMSPYVIYKWPHQKKLVRAMYLKQQGTNLFKRKAMEDAEKKYVEAINVLQLMTEEGLTNRDKARKIEVIIPTLNNLAVCRMKLNRYEQACLAARGAYNVLEQLSQLTDGQVMAHLKEMGVTEEQLFIRYKKKSAGISGKSLYYLKEYEAAVTFLEMAKNIEKMVDSELKSAEAREVVSLLQQAKSKKSAEEKAEKTKWSKTFAKFSEEEEAHRVNPSSSSVGGGPSAGTASAGNHQGGPAAAASTGVKGAAKASGGAKDDKKNKKKSSRALSKNTGAWWSDPETMAFLVLGSLVVGGFSWFFMMGNKRKR